MKNYGKVRFSSQILDVSELHNKFHGRDRQELSGRVIRGVFASEVTRENRTNIVRDLSKAEIAGNSQEQMVYFSTKPVRESKPVRE